MVTNMVSSSNIKDMVVEYLRHADSSSGIPEIENAVLQYIATRDDVTQKRIYSRWIEISKVQISVNPANDPRKRQRTQEPEESHEAYDQRPENRSEEAPDQDSVRGPEEPRQETPCDGPIAEPDQELNEQSNELRQRAERFFEQRRRQRCQGDGPLKPALTWKVAQNAITALQIGYEWNCENNIEDLWVSKDPVTSNQPPEDVSPLRRLTRLYNSVLSSEHSNEVRRRIIALLIHHECRENRISTRRVKAARKGTKIEEGKEWNLRYAEKTGMCFDHAIKVNYTAYAWIKFIRAWGIGSLVMPGPGQRNVFERQLSVEHATDLWAFCETHMPDLALKVGSMHETVRTLLVKAVRIYKGDEESLQRSTRSALAELYRTHWKQGTNQSLVQASGNVMDSSLQSGSCAGSTGMDVLAAAASHHDRLQDSLGPQASGLDVVPTADVTGAHNGNVQDSAVRTSAIQETHRTKHQMHRQTLSSQWPQMLETSNAATGSGQHLQNGNSLQPVFWPTMNSCGPYATIPQNNTLLQSASNYPFAQPGQAGTDMETYTTSTAPDVDDSWPDDYYPSMFDGLIQPYSMDDI